MLHCVPFTNVAVHVSGGARLGQELRFQGKASFESQLGNAQVAGLPPTNKWEKKTSYWNKDLRHTNPHEPSEEREHIQLGYSNCSRCIGSTELPGVGEEFRDAAQDGR